MLEEIFVSIVSSLIAATTLEAVSVFKFKRAIDQAVFAKSEPQTLLNTSPCFRQSFFSFERIVKALISGFLFAGILAGTLEAEGFSEIKLGSTPMLVLLAVCTTVSWWAFFRSATKEGQK